MSEPKSIYHSGATDGLIMGIFMATAFLLQATQIGKTSMLGLLSSAMVLAVPVLAYVLMARSYRQQGANRFFSTVWMHGITIFICGGLILGVVQYIYTRFIAPTFITDSARLVADLYTSLDGAEYQQIGTALTKVIDEGLLPSPIRFAFSMIWTVGFAGSLLSLLLTCIIKLFCHPKNTNQEVR